MCIWGGMCMHVCGGKVHRLVYACMWRPESNLGCPLGALHSSETESFIGLKLTE